MFAGHWVLPSEERRMIAQPLPTYRQAIAICAFTAVSALVCVGLMSAAALVPAPPEVLPFVIVVCVVYPMLAAWRSASSLAVLRHRWPRRRLDERALGELRRELDRLPEVRHPLDR
jgi:hypothetical protein